MSAQQHSITNIGIKRIKELSFSIDESIGLSSTHSASIGFEIVTNFNPEEKSVELVLSIKYVNPESNGIIMQIKVSNEFFLEELQTYYDKNSNTYIIPDQLMITFISLTITHTRALLAKNTSGTKYSELYIPIMNPVDVFNHFKGKNQGILNK